jgi:hypothetical protein
MCHTVLTLILSENFTRLYYNYYFSHPKSCTSRKLPKGLNCVHYSDMCRTYCFVVAVMIYVFILQIRTFIWLIFVANMNVINLQYSLKLPEKYVVCNTMLCR